MTRAQRLLLGLGLTALVLAGILVAQRLGLGDGYSLAALGGAKGAPVPDAPTTRRGAGIAPFARYDELMQRPLFNEDRKPTPVEAEVDETPVAAVAALDAELTGVILMPKLKMAMIREKASGKAMRVRMGSELDGALSGWKLVELEPRKAVFEAEGQERQELELAIDKAGSPALATPNVPGSAAQAAGVVPNAPPPQQQSTRDPREGLATPQPPQPGMANANALPGTQPGVEPSGQSPVEAEQPEVAESIRRRIEERRRQLREEAARIMQQPQK